MFPGSGVRSVVILAGRVVGGEREGRGWRYRYVRLAG